MGDAAVGNDSSGSLSFAQEARLVASEAETAPELEIVRRLRASGAFTEQQLGLIHEEVEAYRKRRTQLSSGLNMGPGDRLGHYVLGKLLARGGEGAVFQALDLDNGQSLALKILENIRMNLRFQREMQLVLRLAHPNIVTAYEVAEYEHVPYIAMELLCGPDLDSLVTQAGPRHWLEATRYIVQVARALVHAHDRELVHRDIKPANIIKSGADTVKLVDLGLAYMDLIQEETRMPGATRDNQVAGTLSFMSPEQASSLHSADRRSDIYSLGATWFYLLTGKSRLPGETLSERFANLLVHRRFRRLPSERLPLPLQRIMDRMLAYDPNDRFTDCREVNREIEAVLKIVGQSVEADKIQVLVVEDSHVDMIRTLQILRSTNTALSILEAQTLAEGLSASERNPIDLVLLDLNLPDSIGLDTIRSFEHLTRRLPVVVLTGTLDQEIQQQCLQAGCSGCFSKAELTAHKMERIIFVALSRFCSPAGESGPS